MIIKAALEQLGLGKQESPEQRQKRALREFNANLSSKGFAFTKQELEHPTMFPYNEGTLSFTDHEAGFLVQHPEGPQLLLDQIHRFKELGDYTAWSLLDSHQKRGEVEVAMEFIHKNKELFIGRLGQDTLTFLFDLPGRASEEVIDHEDDEEENIGLVYVGPATPQTAELASAPIFGEDDEDESDRYEVGSWDMIEVLFNSGCFNYQQIDNQECKDMLGKVGLSLERAPGEQFN